MGTISVDVTGEEFRQQVIPAAWYKIEVIEIPKILIGKQSGAEYVQWELRVISPVDFDGAMLTLRTTLAKGDNPKKSKRWLFHQCMLACKIEKVREKYIFELKQLVGKQFWVKVIVKEETYNDKLFEKNEIKMVALSPRNEKSNPESILEDPDGMPF